MKKVFAILIVLFIAFNINAGAQATANKQTGTKQKSEEWFKKKAWLHGLHLKPDAHINKEELARQYHLNQKYWDEAFAFLRDHDLKTLAAGKYPIDGDKVFAIITEDSTKDLANTKWESHRKYIDLQCVITGKEKMGRYPVAKAKVINPYNEEKDIANYEAPGEFFIVPAGTFMIFFPADAHRPNITPENRKYLEKKIVIKVRTGQ
ncbi:MAG TPA: YhcH/YjgK/YiaL family protein [Chitinophagaceae bacterium]|nr:YhcH/YjgK/YiaL family protein [Chitinophagaceae bacterium]